MHRSGKTLCKIFTTAIGKQDFVRNTTTTIFYFHSQLQLVLHIELKKEKKKTEKKKLAKS